MLITIFLMIIVGNIHFILSTERYGNLDLNYRIKNAEEIINLANDREFNLVGEGPWSQHESFISNYKYLLWYMGKPESDKKENLKFYVSEPFDRINIRLVEE
jgi:hypothetical protein